MYSIFATPDEDKPMNGTISKANSGTHLLVGSIANQLKVEIRLKSTVKVDTVSVSLANFITSQLVRIMIKVGEDLNEVVVSEGTAQSVVFLVSRVRDLSVVTGVVDEN